MQPSHSQPGRRLATGCNRADTLLALFHFVAHGSLFLAIGAAVSGNETLAIWSGSVAFVLLVVRAGMVGSSTTKESFKAIWKVWF